MVRTKKRTAEISWKEEVKRESDTYKGKWVEGDGHVFWVGTVYPEIGGGVACTLFFGDNYQGQGRKVRIEELRERYKVVPKQSAE